MNQPVNGRKAVEAMTERQRLKIGKNYHILPAKERASWQVDEIVGGIVTIGYQDNGKPVELKVDSSAFKDLCERLAGV
jgi:hypothetical protein